MKRPSACCSFVTLVLLQAAAGCAQRSSPHVLHVEDPDVRVLPTGVGAFYGRIVNDTDSPRRLRRVESARVGEAQMHEVMNENGVVGMREATEGFMVPVHGSLRLTRGGAHIMLFDARPDGSQLPLTFHFESGETVVITAPVRSALED